MEAVFGWIVANPGAAGAIGSAVGAWAFDIIRGAIPDEYDKYKGITRRALEGLVRLLSK